MADLEKTVSILFKGVDEISGTLTSISGNLSSFGGSLESATQPLANMAMAIEKADAALAVLAIGGLVVATSAAGAFQSGMNEIHTLLRESPEVVAAFDASIEDYARNSTQSIEDIQKAIYQSLSANVSYGESIAFVTDAEKLAVAGKSTLTEAVDLLTSTLTAYGAGWNEASKYSDVFFKTVEIGKITIPELSQSLALVAPIAATAGISIEEVGAAMAAMTAGGLTAGPSAEYLRHAISDLIDPAKEARGKFDELGIAYGGAELSAHGLSGKMAEIWEKSNGNIDVIAKLFGNVTSMTAAMTLGKDSSGYYAKALEELANAAGATDRAYGIMVDNFGLINQRLVNSIKLALIEAGKPLLDDWKELAIGLGEVFKGIDVGLKAGAFDEVYSAIQKFSDEVTGYFNGVAKAMPEAMALVDFGSLIKSIKNLGAATGDVFKTMFGEVDLKTPEGLATVIQKVVDGVTVLMNVSKGIMEGLKPFAEGLAKLASEAMDSDEKTQELTGKVLGFGQGVNTAISALNGLGPALNILSGSLIFSAISNIGSISAALLAAPWAAAAAGLLAIGYAANSLNPPIDLATAKFDEFGNLMGDFDNIGPGFIRCIGDIGHEMNDLPEVKTFTINGETGAATEKLNVLNTSILSFPPDFSVEAKVETSAAVEGIKDLWKLAVDLPDDIDLNFNADTKDFDFWLSGLPAVKDITVKADADTESVDDFLDLIQGIPRNYSSVIDVKVDKDSVEKTQETIQQIVRPDGTIVWIDVGVKAGAVDKVKKDLDEVPTEKMMEIKIQGNIDKDLAVIKAGAETVQSAMEWTAKVKISGIEGETEQIKALFSSVSATIDSVSDEIGSMFSHMPKSDYDFGANEWKDSLKQAMEIQKESFKVQKELILAQISLIRKKEIMMMAGKGLIQIDSSGLEPALEMIMWQLLQKVQLRANEEAEAFLLGIGV